MKFEFSEGEAIDLGLVLAFAAAEAREQKLYPVAALARRLLASVTDQKALARDVHTQAPVEA